MTGDRGRPTGRLEVRADLRLTVDGIDVRVTGDGQTVHVETDQPVALLRQAAALGRATPLGWGGAARVADALAEQGLTVVAPGPRGTSVRLGADASSRLTGRLLGTPNVQVSGVTSPAYVVAAASALAVVIGWLVRRRNG